MNTVDALHHEAFNQQAEAAVRQYCREVHELTIIEHSGDNLIIIANRQFVFRFPRGETAQNRLYFETALLQKLQGKITSVPIPQVVHINHHPLFVVSAYLEGVYLTAEQIGKLSVEEQTRLGTALGDFMVQLNRAITGAEIKRLRTEAQVVHDNGTWEEYFERLFGQGPLPNERLRSVTQQYYALWKDYVAHQQRTMAIHDDLHPANLLFWGANLSGILDFGDANMGSFEEELRWVFAMGDTVLSAAAAELQRQGTGSVNRDHVRVWAIMHELASFTNGLATQQTGAFPFLRAQKNLHAWLPDFPM